MAEAREHREEGREARAEARPESPRREREREQDYWFRVSLEAPRFMAVPRDFNEHLRAAQREVLLAMRSLLDAAIERMEERDRGRSRRVTRIQVE